MLMRRVLYPLALCCLLALCSGTAFAYKVENGHIVNDQGKAIQLRGASWYGAEVGDRLVPSGLFKRGHIELITELKQLGFNAVRLPFCPAILRHAPFPKDYYWINKALNPTLYKTDGRGRTPVDVLEHIAAEFDRQGFYILLDHHRIDCEQIAPLWYNDDYSEAQWLADVGEMAQRFARFDGFLGIDLSNEPYGATWAKRQPTTDWDAAAERGAATVLKAAPQTVVFVEGVAETGHCANDNPWWWSSWGGNLSRQACHPIDIPTNKLVFAPHAYGPTEVAGGDDAAYFYTTDPNNPRGNPGTPADMKHAMPIVWEQFFGRLTTPEHGNHAIVIGEFNSRYGRFLNDVTEDEAYGIDPNDSARERRRKIAAFAPARARDKAWLEALLGYLTEKGIDSTFWWAINGDGPTGGIYYGRKLPGPDGKVNPDDEWQRIRRDIVNDDPDNPGLLNRFWAKSACFDGIDNDRDGQTDGEDDACEGVERPGWVD